MHIAKKCLAAASFALLISNTGFAMPLMNGTFDDGTAWNDASFSGTVDISGGIATLATGAGNDLFSAVMVQGDDGFFSFASPILLDSSVQYLNFDIQFEDLGIDGTEGTFSLFDDNLSVALYDALDPGFDTFFTSGIDFLLSTSWMSVSLDVSAMANREIALSFELNDEADGYDSAIYLDNVSFTSAVAVMEPGVLALFLTGFAGIGAARKRRRVMRS